MRTRLSLFLALVLFAAFTLSASNRRDDPKERSFTQRVVKLVERVYRGIGVSGGIVPPTPPPCSGTGCP